ncbi:hypothetical protein TWF696_003326 [Orbilia brochopaga]|uniref:Uncharacterized protein n=1 Tax=Orbilia brochopaga TaxID=3140254 RepID=A0AAV9TY71_9PEZI
MRVLKVAAPLLSTTILVVHAAIMVASDYSHGPATDLVTRGIHNAMDQTQAPPVKRDEKPYQQHVQFPADEFLYTEKFNIVMKTVQSGLDNFNGTERYCTTWWKQDDMDDHGDYSQASMWCQKGYSIELWNKRNGTDDPSTQNVRIFCHDALLIAEEALEAAQNGTAALSTKDPSPPDPPGRYRQRWLVSSMWTEDTKWGVGVVYLKDGCPESKDKGATVTFSYEGKPADRSNRMRWESPSGSSTPPATPSATPSPAPSPRFNGTMPHRAKQDM